MISLSPWKPLMARSLEFDRTKALEAAMKLFWSRGYTATSLPDLLATMGIARSSFYASFGTKRSLFIECLELFGDRTLAIVDKNAKTQSAMALPRAFFETTVLGVSPRKAKQGCMMVNTILELADVDPELNELATQKLNAIEDVFVHAFKVARQSDQLGTAHTPEELASMVMTINLGLRVQSRKNHSREALKSIINTSLSMLDLAA